MTPLQKPSDRIREIESRWFTERQKSVDSRLMALIRYLDERHEKNALLDDLGMK